MSRQSEKVSDELESIVYEGDVARQWLHALLHRSTKVRLLGAKNRVVQTELKAEFEEIARGEKAIEKAVRAMDVFRRMVQRRDASLAEDDE